MAGRQPSFYDADPTEAHVADEVHQYLTQLDALREDCERRGDFLKAHECVNRMREVNLRFAKRLEKKSHQANVDTKVALAEEHKQELLTFSRLWEDKIRDFDDQAARVLDDLKRKHAEDYKAQEGILKVQLMNKRPRFSRAVVDLRNHMERCVAQRDYLGAEEAKKQLVRMEEHELAAFDDSLAATFDKRCAVLKTQYVNELRAVEQKIAVGREELLSARSVEFDKMSRRHENVFRELDSETKLHISRTRQYIHRQVKAMVHDPVKTGMELRGVSATFRDKRAATAAAASASTQRARTPTAGSVNRTRAAGGPGGASRSRYHDASIASSRDDDDDKRFGWW
jgi:hypothetical protein